MKEQLKEQIRDIIKGANCQHCAVQTCDKRTGRCGAFIPSADLYTMIAKKCKEVVA